MESEKGDRKGIIFGFNQFSDNAILMAAPYDIGSNTTSMVSTESFYESEFRTSENMINHTKWFHNEVCVERRIEGDKNQNIEPDYIVCLDEIDEDSVKVAKDFGIPIVRIDTKELAKSESKQIEEGINKFLEEPNETQLRKTLMQYFNNVGSYSQYKSDLLKTYFSFDEMQERINQMMERIEEENQKGNHSLAISCYETLANVFQEQIDQNTESGIEVDDMGNHHFSFRKFTYAMREKIKELKEQPVVENKPRIQKSLRIENVRFRREKDDTGHTNSER